MYGVKCTYYVICAEFQITSVICSCFRKYHSSLKTSKTGLQRPAARHDVIGKIGGGYGFLVSMVSRVVSIQKTRVKTAKRVLTRIRENQEE